MLLVKTETAHRKVAADLCLFLQLYLARLVVAVAAEVDVDPTAVANGLEVNRVTAATTNLPALNRQAFVQHCVAPAKALCFAGVEHRILCLQVAVILP